MIVYNYSATLFEGQVIIPIAISKNPDEYKVQFPGQNKHIGVKVKSHSVEMGYAITVHKIQGQTKLRLIVDFNYRPAPTLQQLNFQGFYVALSRVRKGSNLKIMPLHNASSLDYLYSLNLPEYLTEWEAGFNADGIWSAEEAHNKMKRP